MEKILNRSNSYRFYKSNYNKLKNENNEYKNKLNKEIKEKEVLLNKKISLQKKLSKFTKPLILDKLVNKQYNDITIAIKSPNPINGKHWGDYFFSKALKKSFEKKGFNVIVQEREHWYDEVNVDIAIVLRGLIEYEPKYNEINLMWNISHPELVSDEEYEKYDIVFVASQKYAEILNKRLNNPVETLFQCTDPEVFHEIEKDRNYEILFVGVTRGIYRKIVKDCLEKGHDINIYGMGWEDFIDKKYIKGDFIPNDDLFKYYSSCGILLNDHWEDMRQFDFPSNRLFDALACGTFVISDDIESAKTLFNNTIITYSDSDDLDEKINYYLNNPKEAQLIAQEGKKIVLKHHTFDNRVDEILTHLFNLNF